MSKGFTTIMLAIGSVSLDNTQTMIQPEFNQQPQNQEMIDMMKVLQDRGLLEQINQAQRRILDAGRDDDAVNQYIAEQLRQLNGRIGSEYSHLPADLLAIAQVLDDENILTGGEELIQKHRDMVYIGVDSFLYQGSHTLALRFHDNDQRERDYLVRLADLSLFELASPGEEQYGFKDIIIEAGAAAQKRACRPSFLRSGFDDQQKDLDTTSLDIKGTIADFCGPNAVLVVGCRDYYNVPPTANDFLENHVDQSALSPADRDVLVGAVVEVLYVETMLDCTQVFNDAFDYIVGDGAPCLVLQPVGEVSHYYVPLLSVTDLSPVDVSQ